MFVKMRNKFRYIFTLFVARFGAWNRHLFVIAVITVEPADKIPFVYNCMQRRLRGQYNEK